MVVKPVCEPATQGSVIAFHFKYQYVIKYSFLMIKLSLEIVLCIILSKKKQGQSTWSVISPVLKALVQGYVGSHRTPAEPLFSWFQLNSLWNPRVVWLCIFPSLEPAPYQVICQSNPWTCPRSQYWVCEQQFYTFLPSSISLEIFSSLMRFLWIESSVFQRSEDFRLHIYKNIYLFIWLHRVLVVSCGIFPCRS